MGRKYNSAEAGQKKHATICAGRGGSSRSKTEGSGAVGASNEGEPWDEMGLEKGFMEHARQHCRMIGGSQHSNIKYKTAAFGSSLTMVAKRALFQALLAILKTLAVQYGVVCGSQFFLRDYVYFSCPSATNSNPIQLPTESVRLLIGLEFGFGPQ